MRETLSGDLIERLIADIIEVTETLLTTSMLTIPGQDLISALVPSNPAPILEAVALKAGAPAKVSNQLTHSKKNVIFSFFESIGALDFLGIFAISLTVLVRYALIAFLGLSRVFMDSSVEIPSDKIEILAAASSGNMSVHQPDHAHGRPQSSNFEIFGEEKGQSTFAKQC